MAIIKFPTPTEYFVEAPLYKPHSIVCWQDITMIEFIMEPIDVYCIDCGRQSVFSSGKENIPRVKVGDSGFRPPCNTNEIIDNGPEVIFFRSLHDFTTVSLENYAYSDRVFRNRFHCTRSESHVIEFHSIVKKNNLLKFGQFPSLASLQELEIQKYKKVLGDRMYFEFNRAIGLSAHGVGIGSFVYLRRIFETLIKMAKDKSIKQNSSWNESAYNELRMEEKILYLKDYLPKFLVENRKMYSILSLGIHELDEDDCLTHFEHMKIGIMIILDEYIQDIEKQEKIKHAQKAIESISSKLKK